MKKELTLMIIFAVLTVILLTSLSFSEDGKEKYFVKKINNDFSALTAENIQSESENYFVAELTEDEKTDLISKGYEIQKVGKAKAFLQDTKNLTNATYAWNYKVINNITGLNQTVCIIDTGVNYSHPNLGNCTAIGNNCKVIAGYDFINEDDNPMDDNGHGSYIASVVAASNYNGLSGIAPDARIVAMKVLNVNGTGYMNDIKSAIDWCIDNSTKYNISNISNINSVHSVNTGMINFILFNNTFN